jgi:excinuclease ABC subunit B
MPEVSLVAILDADKEGFLRSAGSLIQTIGRAARNLRGKANPLRRPHDASMQLAIDETDRRRAKQSNTTPSTASSRVRSPSPSSTSSKARAASLAEVKKRGVGRTAVAEDHADYSALNPGQIAAKLKTLEDQMYKHARDLEFEEAASLSATRSGSEGREPRY